MRLSFSSSSLGTIFGLARPVIDPSVEAQILNASVQIRLFTPALQQQDIAPGDMRYEVAAGLGTFATLAGEPVIITHNHWGEDLEIAQFVRFYDAWGKEQLRLSGADFRELIVACAPALDRKEHVYLDRDAQWSDLRPQLGIGPDDVFVVVHRHLGDYDPARPLRPWLFGITVDCQFPSHGVKGRTA